ncbi:MAG: flagellar filament capping protein FliD [Leptospirales bacterium]|nr:flagellar filament capping protein FliD [Leptospirales bacterium]
MPAPPMMDLGSGINTRDTINKLLEVERAPIARIQADNQMNEVRIMAWDEVRNRARSLADKSRLIYSFAGAFATRGVVSSDPGAITGEAAPNVELGRTDIEVVQLASNHQVRSNAVSLEDTLPAGRFVIKVADREIAIQFGGGHISDLYRQLRSQGADLFDASSLNPESGKQVISLRSRISGERGRFQFTDPDGVLQRVGLVGAAVEGARTPVQKSLSFEGASPYTRPGGTQAAPIASTIEEGGAALRLEGSGAVAIGATLPEKAQLRLRITRLDQSPTSAPEGAAPANSAAPASSPPAAAAGERIATGPDLSVQVGDVQLHGYQIERERSQIPQPAAASNPAAGQPPVVAPAPGAARFGVGIEYRENGELRTREEIRELHASGESQEIQMDLVAPGPVERIYFFNESGAARFQAATISGETPAQATAVNETQAARDAILKINGVEVRRSENQKLTDVMQGVSLNLNRVTNGPVEVQIMVNAEEIMKQIVEWVKAYNELVVFCRDNSQAGDSQFTPPSQQDQRQQQQQQNSQESHQRGLFASDATVRQLVSGVRLTVSSSYPSVERNGYRVLSDIGLSTGEVGQTWSGGDIRDEVKYGLLVINEERLQGALTANPDSVRQLFASDTNEDNLPDNGVAIAMERLLQPYVRPTGGVISARVDLLKEQIRANKREIDRRELAAQNMEQNLRERFGRMERAVQENRSMGEYLRRNSPGGGN